MNNNNILSTKKNLNIDEYKEQSVKKSISLFFEITDKEITTLEQINSFGIKNAMQKQRGKLVEMSLFYAVKKIWPTLPLAEREKYNDNFYTWCNYIRVAGGAEEQKKTTIDNNIGVFKTFYGPDRVLYQQTIQDPKTNKKINVEEELKKVAPTKLLVAKGFVNNAGRIPNDILFPLLDKDKSKRDVEEAILDYNLPYESTKKTKIPEIKENLLETKLYTTQDGIHYKKGGTSVKLYDILLVPSTALHIEGSKLLLQPHNIAHHYNGAEYPQEEIKDNVYTNKDGHICVTDGKIEFRFEPEDALQLAQLITNQVALQG